MLQQAMTSRAMISTFLYKMPGIQRSHKEHLKDPLNKYREFNLRAAMDMILFNEKYVPLSSFCILLRINNTLQLFNYSIKEVLFSSLNT